jgi:hypothetical protein
MEQEKISPPWWGIFEVIEAIARALDIKDFAVDTRSTVKRIEYDSENKVVKIKDEVDGGICVDTLAHELYHHYQNLKGLLPAKDSDEHKEYVAVRFQMHTTHRPNLTWSYLTFTWEAHAEMFGRVFLERQLRYTHKLGVITDEVLAEHLEEAAQIGIPQKYFPRHAKHVERFKGDLFKIHKAIEAKYADKIDAALEATLGKQLAERKYSFKIIRDAD